MSCPSLLLVEDDPSTRSAMEYMLRRSQFTVLSFATAEAAFSAISCNTFAAAVLDVRLPGMRGDLMGWLLRSRQPECAIVFVSGEYVLDQRSMPPGSMYFPKPVNMEKVLEYLNSVVAPANAAAG